MRFFWPAYRARGEVPLCLLDLEGQRVSQPQGFACLQAGLVRDEDLRRAGQRGAQGSGCNHPKHSTVWGKASPTLNRPVTLRTTLPPKSRIEVPALIDLVLLAAGRTSGQKICWRGKRRFDQRGPFDATPHRRLTLAYTLE